MSKPTSNSPSINPQTVSKDAKAIDSNKQVNQQLSAENISQDSLQDITAPLNEQAQHAVQEIAQSVEEISEHEVARKDLDVDERKKKEETDELLQDLAEAPVEELNSEGGMLLAENTAAPAATATDARAAEAGAGGGIADSVGAAVAGMPLAPLIGLGALAMAGGGGGSAVAAGFTISGAISLGKISVPWVLSFRASSQTVLRLLAPELSTTMVPSSLWRPRMFLAQSCFALLTPTLALTIPTRPLVTLSI